LKSLWQAAVVTQYSLRLTVTGKRESREGTIKAQNKSRRAREVVEAAEEESRSGRQAQPHEEGWTDSQPASRCGLGEGSQVEARQAGGGGRGCQVKPDGNAPRGVGH